MYSDYAEFLFSQKMQNCSNMSSDQLKIRAVLHRSCEKLFQWSNQWLLRLNADKCKVLSIGSKNITDFRADVLPGRR